MSKKACRRIPHGAPADYWKHDRKPSKTRRNWEAYGLYGIYAFMLLFVVSVVTA